MVHWNPEIGTRLVHLETEEHATVVNRSEYWGWYEVEFNHGGKRIYNVIGGKAPWKEVNEQENIVEAIARADRLLNRENFRITDSWYED